MAEMRKCAQCGAVFTPRREHARFCSTACRTAWNTERSGVAAAPLAAIDWSVTAMTEAARRFAWAGTWDLPRAAAAVGEAVWQITLVDATLVRYHRQDYENTLACLSPARQRKTEEGLAGLRYVRNRLGSPDCPADPAEFIRPGRGTQDGSDDSTWTWKPLSEPSLKALPASARDWEISRYRSYQDRLAGRSIARIFTRCADFLQQAAAAPSAGGTEPASAHGVYDL
jgi:hypothetical protein